MWTLRGNTNFRINCESQDSNSRPWDLIPCQASCTSQRNQKCELMERASTIHLCTSTICSIVITMVFKAVRRSKAGKIPRRLWGGGARCLKNHGYYYIFDLFIRSIQLFCLRYLCRDFENPTIHQDFLMGLARKI
jgi:hypothetical protein